MNELPVTPSAVEADRSPVPDHAWPGIAARLHMTDRETAIVRGLFQRLNEEAIGSALGISHHTVHTHLNRIYRKLAVQSRADLFLRVVKEYVR